MSSLNSQNPFDSITTTGEAGRRADALCFPRIVFGKGKKKNPWCSNLELEELCLFVQLLPASGSCVCVRDNHHGSVSFHLFIIHIPPTSNDKCKAWKESFAFCFVLGVLFFCSFSYSSSYNNSSVLLRRPFKKHGAKYKPQLRGLGVAITPKFKYLDLTQRSKG